MYNKAILIGRLAADPEMRMTPQGVPVSTFRIAVDRPFTNGGERKADFLTIVCWRKQAEFVVKYFSKGKAIGVDGWIQTRDYTDKDGGKRTAFEIVADRVFFAGSKASGGGTPTGGAERDTLEMEDDEDLPF